MSSSRSNPRHLTAQQFAAPATEPDNSGVDTFAGHLHKPSSALKKEGWKGFMREVNDRGILVVTHHHQPEAVVLSVELYMGLACIAQRASERENLQLAELSSRFDQRLASLNTPQAHHALHAFMDERVELKGAVRSGAGY